MGIGIMDILQMGGLYGYKTFWDGWYLLGWTWMVRTCTCNVCLHAPLWIEGPSLTQIYVRINRFNRGSK